MTAFNSKQIKIAKPYASALCAFDERDKIFDELKNVSSVISNSDDLKQFLVNPIVSINDKKEIIAKVFEDLSLNTKNFLFLLADKNRIDYFESILEQFGQELDEINNVKRVEIISAVELNEDEKFRIKDKLQRKLSCEVAPLYKIDAAIVAGLVIKIGDKVIDNSLKSRIEGMKRQLI